MLAKLMLWLTQCACSEYVIQEDMTKAARKVGEAKKHESKQCSSAVLISDRY